MQIYIVLMMEVYIYVSMRKQKLTKLQRCLWDELLHKKQMAFIDFLGNLPTYDGQMKEPIIIHGQKTSIFQNAYRMADTRFAKAHVPGKVNGADHAHFLL